MIRRCTILIGLILLIAGGAGGAGTESGRQSPPERVVLQLKWTHQFQFAGYYAALHKGFYREAGLDVEIREYTPDRRPVAEVTAGRADFGVAGAELMLDFMTGTPVRVLAVIFQHSPSAILARRDTGIIDPHDLAGKQLMLSSEGEPDLMAMLLNEGVTPDRYQRAPLTWDVRDIIEGRVDAMAAYITNTPYNLAAEEIPYTLIRPRTYGVDFYGDCLFTARKTVRDHPDRVRRFRSASLRGWAYAMAHVDEMIDLIVDHYPTDKTEAHLRFEADAMRELIVPSLVEIGHMNPGRWRRIADTYVALGMAQSSPPLSRFLYDPSPSVDWTWLRRVLIVSGVAGVLVIGIAGWLWWFNRRLRAAVRNQTADLRRLNDQLRSEIGVRRETERSLRDSEARLNAVIDNAASVIFIKDPSGRYLRVNGEFERVTGHPADDVVGLRDVEIFGETYGGRFAENDRRILSTGAPAGSEDVLPQADGLHTYLTVRFPLTDAEGRVSAVCGIATDITDRKRAIRAIEDSEAKLRAIAETAYDGIIVIDDGGRISFWNAAAERMFGYPADEVIGRTLHDLITVGDDLLRFREKYKTFSKTGTGDGIGTVREFTARRRNGETFPVERTLAAFRHKGKWWAAGTVRDITDRKQAQERLQELATTDGLTGLLNRRQFMDLSVQELRKSRRLGDPLSLLMIDADRFKDINDTYGHDVGDQVLTILASVGRETLRDMDIFGRVGGEEFAVLLPATDGQAAEAVAHRLRSAVEGAVVVTGRANVRFTISIGVTVATQRTEDLNALMREADRALYEAKRSGRNRVRSRLPDENNRRRRTDRQDSPPAWTDGSASES